MPPPSLGRAKVKPAPGKTRLRRDEILDEATRLFAERGYEGASMADLAERVGLRKASLFHHFPSKDVLYAAVLERLFQPLAEALERAVRTEGSFEQRLDALTDAITDSLGVQPYTARLLVREIMDWGPVVRDKLSRVIMNVLDGATHFARAGQDAGVFDERADVKHTILSIVAIHFLPFSVDGIIEKYMGVGPHEPGFVEARRAAAREHVRLLTLRRKK